MTKDEELAMDLALEALEAPADIGIKSDKAITAIKQARSAPVQSLPFGVGGGLVAIKTLLSRDPCVHANTAIEMLDAILKEHPAAQPAPVQEPEYIVHSNGRYSPLLTRMMNKRVESNVKQVIHLYDEPPAQPAPVPRGSIQHLKTTMEESAWEGRLELSDALLNIDEFYTTPRAAQPAVPDAIIEAGESPEFRDGWNECRETMLQMLKARKA